MAWFSESNALIRHATDKPFTTVEKHRGQELKHSDIENLIILRNVLKLIVVGNNRSGADVLTSKTIGGMVREVE